MPTRSPRRRGLHGEPGGRLFFDMSDVGHQRRLAAGGRCTPQLDPRHHGLTGTTDLVIVTDLPSTVSRNNIVNAGSPTAIGTLTPEMVSAIGNCDNSPWRDAFIDLTFSTHEVGVGGGLYAHRLAHRKNWVAQDIQERFNAEPWAIRRRDTPA